MGIGAAFSAFFSIAFNKEKAELWAKANSGELISKTEIDKFKGDSDQAEKAKAEAEKKISELEEKIKTLKTDLEKPSSGEEAIYTLTLLQREGRLIDFLKEDISSFEDAQIGAAVRQVHEGCKKVLEKHFSVTSVIDSSEGEQVEVAKDFDPSEYELSGNVNGEPPYKGELRHKGWKAAKVDLPTRQKGRNSAIICPAEVEV